MEFGKLASVENVDWEIPADDELAPPFLRSLTVESTRSRFRVGAPAWGHREWLGQIYPPGTKTADFLFHYSRNFGSIELNTTHYRIPDAAQIAKWTEQVPTDFRFCPKLWQGISHGGLADRAALRVWCETLPHYGANLGPCFLQLPPHFDYSQKALLFHFLRAWPDEFALALEFRHPSWFNGGALLPGLVRCLQSRKIASVITDVAGRRDVLHTSLSSTFTILRFVGNDLHASDFERSRMWAQRLQRWQRAGLPEVYFFVHEPEDINAPRMADAVIGDLNEICGADLNPLRWVGQRTLFDVT